ncbi:MAG: hypothetical protein ACYSTI_13215 [Planctomycetota bacterium]|jgi:hypothetical protein
MANKAWGERVFIGSVLVAIVGLLLFGSVAIIDTAYHHYQETHAQEEKTSRVWPPAIPSCEKELWERIKGDCNEDSE